MRLVAARPLSHQSLVKGRHEIFPLALSWHVQERLGLNQSLRTRATFSAVSSELGNCDFPLVLNSALNVSDLLPKWQRATYDLNGVMG